MKKLIVFLAGIVCVAAFSIIVYANCINTVEADKVQYPITVDNVPLEQDFPMVSIDDRVYLPLRAMCNIFNIEINWIDEGRIEIFTKNEEADDYQITRNMALKIADVIFENKFGYEFVENTNISIEEKEGVYKVHRYLNDLVAGGDITIYINKKDGRIMDIIAGE